MANGRSNRKNKGNSNSNNNNNGSNNNGSNNVSPVESAELNAEDYEIIAAGLIALGEVFSFLSLLKAKQVTKETGGAVEVPEIFTLSTKKSHKRRLR